MGQLESVKPQGAADIGGFTPSLGFSSRNVRYSLRVLLVENPKKMPSKVLAR